jgi:hypothetical protein
MYHGVIRSRRMQTVPFRTSKEETAATASTRTQEGPVSLFTVVRRQSSNQELLGVASREVAQLTIAARWCICGINRASFAQGRAGPWRHL